jgi:SsrA-binding protein
MAEGEKTVVSNRRARKEYEVLETHEAGMVLTGTEVKALRSGTANLKDAYATVEDGELWLLNMHIGHYPQASQQFQHEPERRRKLLMHRREVDRLLGRVIERGLTLVPLRVYFRRGRAKVEIAVARGKRAHDKRDQLRKDAANREIEQEMRRRR